MMNKIIQEGMLVIMLLAALAAALLFTDADVNDMRVNCDISEIHPDFTPNMREQCRQERAAR